ncbi:MAG: hypothetical protein KJ622_02210, partial [Alphaproteobacteria bacterium]|nr:hypothetical protein [Alphaproteobacteria bacterium]
VRLAVPITQGPQRTTIDTQTGTSKSSTGYHPGQQRRHGATRHAWRTPKKTGSGFPHPVFPPAAERFHAGAFLPVYKHAAP